MVKDKVASSLNNLPKNHRVQVLFSTEDSDKVDKAAAKSFLDRSSFIRQSVLKHVAEVLA
jgi:uncharacterized protein (DUF1778 family)